MPETITMSAFAAYEVNLVDCPIHLRVCAIYCGVAFSVCAKISALPPAPEDIQELGKNVLDAIQRETFPVPFDLKLFNRPVLPNSLPFAEYVQIPIPGAARDPQQAIRNRRHRDRHDRGRSRRTRRATRVRHRA